MRLLVIFSYLATLMGISAWVWFTFKIRNFDLLSYGVMIVAALALAVLSIPIAEYLKSREGT